MRPLTGSPFSSIKRTQKSLRPGLLITAPRMMFLPLFSVRRFGDDVIHYHASVVEEVDGILAVEPPH